MPLQFENIGARDSSGAQDASVPDRWRWERAVPKTPLPGRIVRRAGSNEDSPRTHG